MTRREMEAEKRRKKAIYRRRRIVVFTGGILILVFLIYGGFFLMGKFIGKAPNSSSSQSSAQSSSSSSSTAEISSSEQSSESESSSSELSSSQTSSSTTVKVNPNDWNMILVNRANPIPEDFSVELTDVTGQYKFDARAADALNHMLSDAEAAGHPMVLRSTYRTQARSEELYTAKVQEYVNNGYSQEAAEEEAARWIAPPGTSEHHTGLAADIVSAEYDTPYGT